MTFEVIINCMAYFYKENNVFDEALSRIRMLFDTHDDIIVSMSGGKDSTVLFNLALMVAKEKNRLPLKVFWLDQEAEWQATVDYMDKIMRLHEVKPYWFQVPFAFPNNLSTQNDTIIVWDPNQKGKWIHQKSDIAITESPINVENESRDSAFYTLIRNLPEHCIEENTQNCAVLVGMRISESLNRRTTICFSSANFKGETWCKKKVKHCQVFWPIYDFTNDDIWTAIAKNNWDYNKAYDLMYRWGVKKQNMRISALIHETAWHSIEMLQEFEQETYNKFTARINGASTFNHAFDEGGVIPKKLPFMFKDWKEYRDYLLIHLIESKYWEHFKNEWKGQDSEEYYKTHVREVILGDTCGTLNNNARSRIKKNEKIKGLKSNGVNLYNERYINEFNEYISRKGMTNGN